MTVQDAAGAPVVPAAFIASVTYKPGWSLKVGGPLGQYVCIFATTPDSNNPTSDRCTQHMFKIPDGLDRRAFARWLFDCLLLCELHEAGEFFRVADLRPYMPHHQDEGNPYDLVDRWEP